MAKKTEQTLVLVLLEYAERSGLSMGGLFLLALGMWGGQYARLFPEHMQDLAGYFCLLVAASGLTAVVVQLVKGFLKRTGEALPDPAKQESPSTFTRPETK
jgi:hypothetical protein